MSVQESSEAPRAVVRKVSLMKSQSVAFAGESPPLASLIPTDTFVAAPIDPEAPKRLSVTRSFWEVDPEGDEAQVPIKYDLDQNITWMHKSISRSEFSQVYEDYGIELEYLKFSYWDYRGAVAGGAIGLFMMSLPSSQNYSLDWMGYFLYAVALFTLAITAVYAILVHRRASGLTLEIVLTCIAYLTNLSFCITFYEAQTHCKEESVKNRKSGLSEEDDYALTRQCASAIYPYIMLTAFSFFVWARPRFRTLVVLSCLMILFLFVPRTLYENPPDSNNELAAQISLAFIIIGGFLVFSHTRARAARKHFDAKLEIQQSSEQVLAFQLEIDNVLRNTLPSAALARVVSGERVLDMAESASICFSDIVMFTKWSSTRAPAEVVQLVCTMCSAFDDVAKRLDITKVKTIGDAYWAVCGVPTALTDHATRLTVYGLGIQEAMRAIADERNEPLQIRVGVHTGSIVGGIVGEKQLAYEVYGVANEVAEHTEMHGVPGRVLVTEDTYKLLDKDIVTAVEHGEIEVPTALGNTTQMLRTFLIDPPGRPFHVVVEHLDDSFGTEGFHAIVGGPATTHAAGYEDEQLHQFISKSYGQSYASSQSFASNKQKQVEKFCQKYRWFMPMRTFRDPKVEADYIAFTLETNNPTHLAARVFLLLFLSLFLMYSFAEAHLFLGWHNWGAMSGQIINIVLTLISVHLCRTKQYPRLEVLTLSVNCTLIFVSTGFLAGSALANSPWFLVVLTGCTMCIAVTHLTSLQVSGIILVSVFIPVNLIAHLETKIWDGKEIGYSAVFVIFLPFVLLMQERDTRTRFVAARRAMDWFEAAKGQTDVLVAVLESIVPKEITPILVHCTQMGSVTIPFHPTFDRVGVMFFRRNDEILASHSPIRESSDAMSSSVTTIGASLLSRLQQVLSELEECIAQFKFIAKLKTVGDILIITTKMPRSEDLSPQAQLDLQTVHCKDWIETQRAIVELVDCAMQLQRHAETHDFRGTMGLHCGPATAAIIGRYGVSFDYFGDTMNTASRVCSTNPLGMCYCTEEFATVYGEATALVSYDPRASFCVSSHPATVGDIEKRQMKGKGDVSVCKLSSTSCDASSSGSATPMSQKGNSMVIVRGGGGNQGELSTSNRHDDLHLQDT